MRKNKGSLTVFAALSLMLVAAVLFALLEGARNIELKRLAKIKTDASIESLFACYEKPFWDTYELLGLDCSDAMGEWSLEEAALFAMDMAGRMGGTDLLGIVPGHVEITSCMLLTDGEGAVFEKAVASYMKEHLLLDSVKEMYRNYQSMDAIREGCENVDEAMEAGQEALENQKNEIDLDDQTKQSQEVESANNPMNQIEDAKKKGIIALVLPDDMNLSGKQLENTGQLLSKRKKVIGTAGSDTVKNTWYDRAGMNCYLAEYMGNLRQPSEKGELCYELEYILAGKQNDAENIKSTFNKLVLIREMANLTYLLSDVNKVKKVSEMAAILGGASANPAVAGAVELGILTAWAYAESILDVRTLVNGGKIAIVKSPAQWTCEAEAIAEITSGYQMAKECSNGITYEQYLESMLFAVSEKEIAFRAMELMERSLQKLTECETICLDHFVVSAEIEMTYEWKGIFSPFIWIGNIPGEGYQTKCSSSYSYISQ